MAWIAHPTVNTGQVWMSTDENTYVKGNLDTLFPYANALEIAYSTSATSLNKARALAALNFVGSNISNNAISFNGLVYARQGNSTSDWASTSTSTSLSTQTSLNTVIMQTGCENVRPLGLAGSNRIVTFPQSYTNIPMLFVQSVMPGLSTTTTQNLFPSINTLTSTGFSILIRPLSTTSDYNNFIWMTIGI